MVRHNTRKCEDTICNHVVITAEVVAATDALTVHASAHPGRADGRALALAVDAQHRSFNGGKLRPHARARQR
jgi:hypothetical protein